MSPRSIHFQHIQMPMARIDSAVCIATICYAVALLAIASPGVLAMRNLDLNQLPKSDPSSSTESSTEEPFVVTRSSASTTGRGKALMTVSSSSSEEGEMVSEKPSAAENLMMIPVVAAADDEEKKTENLFDRDVEILQKFRELKKQTVSEYLKHGTEWICPEQEWEQLTEFDRHWWRKHTLFCCKMWQEVEQHLVRWLQFLDIYEHNKADNEQLLLSNLAVFPAVELTFRETFLNKHKHYYRKNVGKWKAHAAAKGKASIIIGKAYAAAASSGRNGAKGEPTTVAETFSTVSLVEKLRVLKMELKRIHEIAKKEWLQSQQTSKKEEAPPPPLEIFIKPKWKNAEVCRKVEKLVAFYTGKKGVRRHNAAIGKFLGTLLHDHQLMMGTNDGRLTIPFYLNPLLTEKRNNVAKGKRTKRMKAKECHKEEHSRKRQKNNNNKVFHKEGDNDDKDEDSDDMGSDEEWKPSSSVAKNGVKRSATRKRKMTNVKEVHEVEDNDSPDDAIRKKKTKKLIKDIHEEEHDRKGQMIKDAHVDNDDQDEDSEGSDEEWKPSRH